MSTVRARDGVPIVARWSSGLRLRPLTPATAVRIRYGSPKRKKYGKHRIPNRVGVDSEEGPPVPIPNTVVKLNSAENTWLEAAREDRSTPTLFLIALIAQSVEHAAVNRGVVCSSQTGGATTVGPLP